MDQNYIELFGKELKKERTFAYDAMKQVNLIQLDSDISILGMALNLKDWDFIKRMIERKKSEKSKIEESLKGNDEH